MKPAFSLLTLIMFFCANITVKAQKNYALTNLSATCVREAPSHSAELGTQIPLGLPVRLLSKEGEWYRIQSPDGYNGYVIHHSLTPLTDDEFLSWKQSNRAIFVSFEESKVWRDSLMSETLNDITPGSIVVINNSSEQWTEICLPDGRCGYVSTAQLQPLTQWSEQEYDADKQLSYAKSWLGKPYLWGGTTSKAMDCSGLTWLCAWMNGRMLPRNASAQINAGKRRGVTEILHAGNLLIFRNPKSGRINHVAIADSDTTYVESSGRVKRTAFKGSKVSANAVITDVIDISQMPSISEFPQKALFFNSKH